MKQRTSIGVRPEHIRYAVGYGSTNAWGIMMLYMPWSGTLGFSWQAMLSMVPGLAMCLGCLLLFRQRVSLAGRTPLVAAASLCTSLGTLGCTYPALAHLPGAFAGGMVLSGAFAILLIMAWFDVFARISPRGIIVLGGASIAVAALESWALIQCEAALASVLVSLLPMLSFVLLPLAAKAGKGAAGISSPQGDVPTDGAPSSSLAAPAAADASSTARVPGLRDVLLAAVPLRTLAGFAITFFVLSSITTAVIGRDTVSLSATSLFIPLGAAAFFVASGFFVRGKIDPSILYKVLLVASAAFVFFSFYLGYGNGGLTLHAHNIIEVMAWVVLALGAKKTPVAPHLVFAVGWIAECAGKTLGQVVAPALAGEPLAFMAIVTMLVLLGIGFAFSEGYHLLDVDFEDGEGVPQGGTAAKATGAREADGAKAGDAMLVAVAAERGGASPFAEAPVQAGGHEVPDGTLKAVGSGSAAEDAESGDVGPVFTAAVEPDPYEAFCAEYDLSPRESDVFRLWVTGHGLKYIQNALFVSESTVKSHLRSIYRKCDTHNRAEIIALFERESAELG